jgi:hypothetical protein
LELYPSQENVDEAIHEPSSIDNCKIFEEKAPQKSDKSGILAGYPACNDEFQMDSVRFNEESVEVHHLPIPQSPDMSFNMIK